jgi:hypothetical protein
MTNKPRIRPRHLAFALLAGALAVPAWGQGAQDWEIGPVIRGKNYSVGMPLRPEPQRRGQGWSFDFPRAPDGRGRGGHVHYVTFDPGSLAGKSKLTLRYRVDAAAGVRFVPQQFPDRAAAITLYFQRRGDNWTAKGRYQYYRWYAPPATMQTIAPGVHEMTVRLDDPSWGSVQSRTAGISPREFRDALEQTARVGLVFGSVGGRGHGVYATGPARFTLLSFRID